MIECWFAECVGVLVLSEQFIGFLQDFVRIIGSLELLDHPGWENAEYGVSEIGVADIHTVVFDAHTED